MASKTALAMAAASGRIELSPAPAGGSSERLISTICLGRLGAVEDWVGEPVGAGDLGAVEGDLLGKRAARALDDVAFDATAQPVGVDDQPAITGDGEFLRPDLAGAAVDLDLGDDRHHRTRALGIGDAAPRQGVAAAVGPRRRARLPPGGFGRGFDDGDVARHLQIAQAEGGGVGADRGGDFVGKGFAGELICGPTGSRRCAVRNGEARSSSGAIVSQARRLLAKS